MIQKEPYYNLKTIMAKNNLTQKEGAKIIDITETNFSLKINRQKGRGFTLDEAIKLAEYLNVKVDEIK